MSRIIVIMLVFIVMNIQSVFAQVNIAYTIDNNYPIFTLLSINSILLNSEKDTKYRFYIIENNLTTKNKEKMKEFVEKRNQKIFFININQPIINEGNIYTYKSCNHVTSIGLARIYLEKLLPQDVDKVIYLDADTLILSDLKELYNIDLEGYVYGMVQDISCLADVVTIYNYENGYYNSGVILMDLKMSRKKKISENLEKFYLENLDKFDFSKSERRKAFLYPDQDLINVVMDNKIKELPPKWNQQYFMKYSQGIIHYIGKWKPWVFSSDFEHNPRKEVQLYMSYWNNCSELKKYRHYYVIKKIKQDYVDNCKKIISDFKKVG